MDTPWSPALRSDMVTPCAPASATAETISGTSGDPVCTRVVTPLSPRILFFAVNDGASRFLFSVNGMPSQLKKSRVGALLRCHSSVSRQ